MWIEYDEIFIKGECIKGTQVEIEGYRTIYDEIDATIEEWSGEFLKGNLDSSVVYVFRNEDYTKEYDEVVKKYFYPILAEKEEVNTENIDKEMGYIHANLNKL